MLHKVITRTAPRTLTPSLAGKPLSSQLPGIPRRNFGLLQEYNERKNKKLINNLQVTDRPMFWVTSARPSNFGDPLDTKTKADNWFDENRLWNEENRDYEIKRAQIYMLQGFTIASYMLTFKTILTVIYNQMITRTRYIRDSYKELDISELPPGEVLQTSWNGEIIFVRRLTVSEVKDTNALPDSSLLDKESIVTLSDAGNSSVLVCSAICTHLGCIPVPYLGAYKGWVCLCHGSVYDKFGRVRQGPAQANLPYINNSVYGPLLCIEEQIFPNEPSIFLYV
jgi:ubiquinol-cytochrome c reductase iron-sulfur subunit